MEEADYLVSDRGFRNRRRYDLSSGAKNSASVTPNAPAKPVDHI